MYDTFHSHRAWQGSGEGMEGSELLMWLCCWDALHWRADDRLPLDPGEESSRALSCCLMFVDQQWCEYDQPPPGYRAVMLRDGCWSCGRFMQSPGSDEWSFAGSGSLDFPLQGWNKPLLGRWAYLGGDSLPGGYLAWRR